MSSFEPKNERKYFCPSFKKPLNSGQNKRPKHKLYIVFLFKQSFVTFSIAVTATMKVLKAFSNTTSLSNTIIQFLANCILSVVFAYWAIEAFQKYSSEPLSTQAQCLKITQNVSFEFSNFGIFHQFLTY